MLELQLAWRNGESVMTNMNARDPTATIVVVVTYGGQVHGHQY
jgi:hypothetical protein